MKHSKVLFIPIETISRELDAKLTLASQLVDSDTTCFVGQHDVIDQIQNFYKNGVYLGKNVFKTHFPANMNIYNQYKKNGHSILWIHEEGGIYPGDENHWKKTLDELLDPKVLGMNDQILTWGKFQKNHYAKKITRLVTSVGSPRFNLSSDSLLRKLVQKFNRVQLRNFILINTNFSISNYISNNDLLFETLFHGHKDKYVKHDVVKLFAQETRTLAHFIEAISELAFRHPEEKFVIRPHPTEATEIYENAFSIYENVFISKEYSAVEWIDRCKVMIQNGCTTSIEAYLMGKKVLNFYPFNSEKLIQATRDVGINCTTIEDLEKGIFEVKENTNSAHNALPTLNRLLENTNQNYDESLLNRIVKKELESKESLRYSPKFSLLKIQFSLSFQKYKNFIKIIPRLLFFPKKQKDYLMAIDHYPGMNKSEIQNKITFLSNELEKNINFNFISHDLMMISCNKTLKKEND
jgi:surface carbohydrate biosynthesis protein